MATSKTNKTDEQKAAIKKAVDAAVKKVQKKADAEIAALQQQHEEGVQHVIQLNTTIEEKLQIIGELENEIKYLKETPVEKEERNPVVEASEETRAEIKHGSLKDKLHHAKDDVVNYTKPAAADARSIWKLFSGSSGTVKYIIIGIIAAVLIFVLFRSCNNRKDDKQHQRSKEKVQQLQQEKDSIQADLNYYKRKAEEQAKETAGYKGKAADLDTESSKAEQARNRERESDKKKVNETKAAIRNAHTDAEIISTLTTTLRQ